MLDNEHSLTLQDENYAKRYLTDLLRLPQCQGKAHGLLARLYNHRARSYQEQAYTHAQQALKLDPNNKENHVALLEAGKGVFTDWNHTNHHKLCDFYEGFCNDNPDSCSGLLYWMDHLIADGRLDEARECVTRLSRIKDGYLVHLYNGKILKAAGKFQDAFEHWEQMVKCDTENWLTWLSMADELSRMEEYNRAIVYYQKALQLQPKPRYFDGYKSMAHIYEIQRKCVEAAEMWESAVKLLEEEWSITFGEIVEQPKREANRLRQLASK